MVCFHRSISVDRHLAMSKSLNSTDPYWKLRQINQFHRRKNASNLQNQLNIPACEQSRYAVIDVIILIAVVFACGFLIYPYVNLLVCKTGEFAPEIWAAFKEEIFRVPMVYACLALSVLSAMTALLVVEIYFNRSCGKTGCRMLRKAAEFDIQLETEDCVNKSDGLPKNGVWKGLFELPRDHHRELEAELKKMAPPNGRAVLIFRARCGCSVGRMEVPGPRKPKKVKK